LGESEPVALYNDRGVPPALSAKIAIRPDPVEKGNTIAVAVDMLGGEPSSWQMRIVSAQDSAVMRAPRGLDTYGAPREGAAGAYDCEFAIIGFEPGEYLVEVAPKGKFDAPDMASKKFTVRPARIIVASAGKKYPDDYEMPGSRYGRF